jgi:hypothetical protein
MRLRHDDVHFAVPQQPGITPIWKWSNARRSAEDEWLIHAGEHVTQALALFQCPAGSKSDAL